jgi:oligosaccharide repeat unit polymerase
MSWISFIFFSISFLLIASLAKNETDVFSPARLFAIVWSLILGLTELKLSGWQKEWSTYSWIVLLLSLLSVLLGMFIIYVINYNSYEKSISEIRESVNCFKINSQLLYRMVLLLFILYIFSYITIYLIVGYLPFFTLHPDLTRTGWQFFGFSLLIHLVPIIIYLIILFYLKTKGQTARKIILTSVLFSSLVSYFFLLQRFDLIIPIILTIAFLYYGTYKFKLKYIFLILSFLMLIIYGISSLRNSNLFIAILYYSGKMKISKSLAIFTEPYMYIVMNLENFANAVDKLSQFSFGYYTFDFVLALTGLKHWIYDYCAIIDFPYIITPVYNTYTMFFSYYRDFGILGIFIFPTIIGMLISTAYYRMRRSLNLYTISLYGIFVFVVIFSFFITMLSWLFFVFILIVISLLTKMVIKN